MKVTDRIINSEVVIDHFGYWPTFHDATINRVIFHTLPTYKYSIAIFITAFEITNHVNQEGYYQLDKECAIEIEFSGIQEVVYEDFNFQNVAFEILFTQEQGLIRCEISPSTGLYAMIKAEEVAIMNLQKLDKGNKDKKTT
jgi:hypothetical protein